MKRGKMKEKRLTIARIAYDAVLSAVCAVLGAYSLDLGSIKFTFENFPVLIGALLFGPIDGLLIGTLGTFMYQLLRYGLDASTVFWILPYALGGLFTGLWAKKVNFSFKRGLLILMLLLNGLLVTGINTASLFIVYKYMWSMPIETVLLKIPLRLLISMVKSAAFALVLPPVLKALKKVIKKES